MLYRVHTDTKVLQALNEIEYAEHSFKERYDIQEWVESTPEILGEDLLVIAKEFSAFVGTRERPDLIALDKQGNIVIIELKRDHSGNDVYLQAIKYASYWSRFQIQHILSTYLDYLSRQPNADHENLNEESAQQQILEFLDNKNLDALNKHQRILIVSHRFSRELITTVDWLIDKYKLDITCLQLIPYYDSDRQTYYLQCQQLLPLPGIDHHFIQPGIGEASTIRVNEITGTSKQTRDFSHRDDEASKFYERLFSLLQQSQEISGLQRPTDKTKHAGKWNKYRYMRFWYNRGLWTSLKLCYHFLLGNWEQSPQHTIGLRVYPEYLYAKGVTEAQVKALCSELESLSKENKDWTWVHNEREKWFELQAKSSTQNLDDEALRKIQAVTEELILKTYPIVQTHLSNEVE